MQELLELKNKLAFINELIIDKSDVVYFDYPLHLNVGDLLIYHGTEQFFLDYGITVRLRRSVRSFSLKEAKKVIRNSTTIICHGGGNFGDLYAVCQRLRETLIKEFPNNRIIVLPQTLFFSKQENFNQSAAIFSKHLDCHLFARDINTYESMRKFSKNVYLSPDMAHQLYGILGKYDKGNTRNEKMYFFRKDIEKASNSNVNGVSSQNSKDWGDIVYPSEKFITNIAWLASEISRRIGLYFINNLIDRFWYKFSKHIIVRSEKEFLSYKSIETDRLHGHIFSCLLGIPNKVIDNSYGKNYSYCNLWTKHIHFVEKDE